MISEQECKAKGGAFKNGVCQVEEGGITKPLKSGGFADQSIVPLIDRLNEKGCPTVASCSGISADHHGHMEGAYLSIEMPEHVVKGGFGRSIHDVDPENVKKPEVVKCFLDAGERANWLSELSLYLLMIPTVRYSLPITKSVKADKLVQADPEVVAAEKKLDEVMKSKHSIEEFLKALDERDNIRDKVYDRFGREQWSDEKVLNAWNRLQVQVEKCCSLLKT
jgi:hypothetical protein